MTFARSPVDEYSAAEFRDQSEYGPARDLRFGDEGGVENGAKSDDVEIGGVIGDEQDGLAIDRGTSHDQSDAQYRGDASPVPTSVAPRPSNCAHRQKRRLHRNLQQGPAQAQYTRRTVARRGLSNGADDVFVIFGRRAAVRS